MKQDGIFFTKEEFQPEVLENGVVRTIKGYIEDLMVAELVWKKGQERIMKTMCEKWRKNHEKVHYYSGGSGNFPVCGAGALCGRTLYSACILPDAVFCTSSGSCGADPLQE